MTNSQTDTGRAVAFITLGCAKNEVDTADMMQRIVQAGYVIAEDPELADAVVVNTCAFIQAATEESIDAVLQAADLPGVASGRTKLIVAGCMPARYRDDLQEELPEASCLLPCDQEEHIVHRLDKLFGIQAQRKPFVPYSVLSVTDDAAFAYVKISDGCDRFCSYCTIPHIRGRYHSFPLEEIMRDVRFQVNAGKREIILIAQDTGRWGADFAEPSSLAFLVGQLAEAFPDVWFRVMYIQPQGITDELLSTVAAHDNICRYFDIPFQHCDQQILKAMNRTGSWEEHLALIGRIRTRIPNVALRTTLIVGFPGETEEQFEQLCDFVEEIEFDYVGAFAYSREEGTRAYDLCGQVPEDEKLERLQRIRDLADSISAGVIAQRTGKHARILVCGCEEDGQLYGRAQCQAPDVDGVTYLDEGDVGDFVPAVIVDTLMYEMEAEVAPKCAGESEGEGGNGC